MQFLPSSVALARKLERMSQRLFVAALAVSLCAGSTSAQAPSSTAAKVATHPLGAVTATSTDSVGILIALRALSTGEVLVNDVQRSRVLLFDKTLKTSKVVMDSGATGGATGGMGGSVTSGQLIPFAGDSSLFVDVSSLSMLVLDPSGKVAHVMSLPRPRDAMFLAQPVGFGTPQVDPKGRLVYRGVIVNLPKPPEPGAPMSFTLPEQPDSAPIVRADFDTRKVDTLTTIKALKPGKMSMAPDKEGNMAMKIVINPLDTGDEWAMITDGSLAIVRAHDYHIDWLDADGTKRSTPKMPFDWKRLTDEQKQFKIDSLRPQFETQLKAQSTRLPTIPTPNGPRRILINFDFPPLKDIPDYEPPVSPGSVKADLDNRLWIAPRTAATASDGGLRYDVVDRNGEIVDRVQFPKGRVLAGFGPGGAIYVLNISGKTAVLERATLK